ncbi:MAG: RNA polymerase sigma factor [Clostridia bacterium]|nr:RNA polymerase sigma factor [Clostridia bacterium]
MIVDGSVRDRIPEDAEIIKLLCNRDEFALRAVLTKYGALMHSLARQITGSEQDAEECVNDAILELWDSVPPASPKQLSAFMGGIVRRRAIDRVRYNQAEKRAGSEYCSSIEELEECLPDRQSEAESDSDEINRCIRAFLDKQKPDDRDMFLMRYFRFLSNEQIALQFGMRESSVVMRLVRMRKRLRKFLNENHIRL